MRFSNVELPRAGCAQQREKLSLRERHRHAVERTHDGVTHAVVALQVMRFEKGGHQDDGECNTTLQWRTYGRSRDGMR
jgi:hypothetical protein